MASNFESALHAIDNAHSDDPNVVTIDDKQVPYELHYANKMSKYLTLHTPSPSDLLRLAVRAQHLRRWEVPRSSYPMNKIGYLSWRAALKKRHASLVEEICLNSGYSAADSERVAALVRKENMKTDEECQILEDVACLVFLDNQFEEFEREHDEEKVIGILRKTWGKMSDRGHELALEIPLSSRGKELITRALT
ncbi:glutamyl-tRNA synthetase [Coccidioides immitis RS]|uniref:Glutamyl-tRNA synthetase n=3 Tax=Coccidioides immitis TaxID=5501 RepID=A0A0E1RWB8_COCIM|nr:glutamyl-tRNA synthetase [Coccidioides immitis RS]EAS31552.2 glutamyl-tRNA synthetase [Coccidioides immitis RS]KMP04197.1 glutamyl-tRNA synthetase [Coccidioides immitis RMSCC 2394]KMU78914.1 glutamyl-tRNA synthetase [Coccidioides immitis RMSCC 3703]TPX24314.1 hypothetical protein DIZ76_013660 [Coccidioides immitis]